MAPRSTRKAPAPPAKSLLDEEAVAAALCAACRTTDEEKAAAHAQRIVRQAFLHERLKVHRKLLADAAELAQDPATSGERAVVRPESEFTIGLLRESLPRGAVEALADWRVLTTKVVHASESSDYVTTKLLIELTTGNQVEAVVLRHKQRTTLCVSSQVGCKMGCTFCATGTLGQRANLTAAEIQEQLIHANRFLKTCKEPRNVTNIVFMGMGEPLNNYKSVVEACRAMTDTSRFSLSPGKVTVSTVGVVNRMRTLYKDVPGVSLALSLHAPNQELRQKIIPTAGAYPIEKLMDALTEYLDHRAGTSKKDCFVMIEYILLSGVNDMPEIAEELAQLMEPIKDRVKLNLIPYNPIFNPEGLAKTFVPPTDEDIETFKNIVQHKYGIFCTVRTEMGQDVNGACGQLACISEEAKNTNVDIEDLYRNRKANVLYDHETGENVKRTNATKREQRLEARRRVREAAAQQATDGGAEPSSASGAKQAAAATLKELWAKPWAPAAAAVAGLVVLTGLVAVVRARAR